MFTRARAVRRASVAGAWREDGGEKRTVACLRLNGQEQKRLLSKALRNGNNGKHGHLSSSCIRAIWKLRP
eukprot:2988461-Pleurochrysis_carterae.AAC.1